MKVVAIIQARMGSTRLPGKVLKKINNKPLLEYQIERLKRSTYIDQLVIATTNKKSDDAIVEFCKSVGLSYFRGSEEDVLSRYYEAAKYFAAEVVVRITSDCPIIDPNVVDYVIATFKNNEYDYVSNTLERSYPRGMDTEVFAINVLKKAYKDAYKPFEREHVTPYIYLNPEMFKLYNLEYMTDQSSHRWTVDTKEDFILIEKILENFKSLDNDFSMEDTLSFLNKHPDLKEINADIEQKKVDYKL
ncbi:acylneuraminate cytidylyltransferase [Salipaludibacillus neizhouensis]|uniref:Acylneuraminate cytidylyltransferase n=1 Tax=Salipaludibacillus neizhouensis TaxID=885475 RepID=A0A3A9KCV5_9BACI|nr:glycosyltransferase family protein [Salipaludibacillus neizhouensis]RKL68341.1 acylneuraminate cytidylyltransferase [Salipaludibacillus neizhouensis]